MTMLETDRLIVRPFRESDYNDLYEYLSLEETYRYEPGDPVSLDEAKKYALKRSNSVNWWAVTLKNDIKDKLIGHVTLFQTDMYNSHLCRQNKNYRFNKICRPFHLLRWDFRHGGNVAGQN